MSLTDMYESTRRFNGKPRLAVVAVIRFVNELILYRYLQPTPHSVNNQSIYIPTD